MEIVNQALAGLNWIFITGLGLFLLDLKDQKCSVMMQQHYVLPNVQKIQTTMCTVILSGQKQDS